MEPEFIDLLKNTNLFMIGITIRISFSSRAQSYRRLNVTDMKLRVKVYIVKVHSALKN